MAVTNAGSSPLTFTNLPVGIQVTKITDTSADWASVSNSTYFYDKADGLVHYKNSSGVVLELFSAGGLTYFTEAEATTSPNNTVYVDSLTAAGSTTNVDIAIRPKGSGAILASIPDNTTTGGNKRGSNSVDLQTLRSAANQVASGASTVAFGSYNIAGGSDSVVLGRANNSSGTYGSIAMGYSCLSNSQVSISIGNACQATASESIAIGRLNTASSNSATAIGQSNVASNSNSICLGSNNSSTGIASVTLGDSNVANSAYGHAQGYYSHTFAITGRKTYASGRESTTGDAQKSTFILRKRTTDATATTITSDSGAASTTNQVILQNNNAFRFKGSIIGKQSGSTNVAAWDVDGLIVRGANAAATTLLISNVTVVQNTPAWGTPTLAADTTNGGLQVQVTGAASTNIQWTATVETTEVIYA